MRAVAEVVEHVKEDTSAIKEVVALFQDLKQHILAKLRKAGLLLCAMDRVTLKSAKFKLKEMGYAGEYIDRIILAHRGMIPEWTLEKPALKVAGFVRRMDPAAVEKFKEAFRSPDQKVKILSLENPQQGMVQKSVEKLSYQDLEVLLDEKKGIADPGKQAHNASVLKRKKETAVPSIPKTEDVLEVKSATFDHSQGVINLRLSNGDKVLCTLSILRPFKSAL